VDSKSVKSRLTLTSIITMTILYLPLSNVSAQECTAHFEVNAGPDIDVCEGGLVNLSGHIGGDASEARWEGGKGTFEPNRKSISVQYTPADEEFGKEVVLTLSAGNPRFTSCPSARSEIKISINNQPKVEAGPDRHICRGTIVQMKGKVTGNAKSITWITNGNGSFDDVHKMDAVYTPSLSDQGNGGCSVMIKAEPFGVCLPDSATMIVSIDPVPEFETASGITGAGMEPVTLSLTAKGGACAIAWTTTGTGIIKDATKAETRYWPSAEDVSKGTVPIEVIVASMSGACSTKKRVVLNIGKNKM
jgi:hypothetical protein